MGCLKLTKTKQTWLINEAVIAEEAKARLLQSKDSKISTSREKIPLSLGFILIPWTLDSKIRTSREKIEESRE